MRVAQIAPLCESVPPRLYGGTERIVAYLTDALVELGCEVTLFASAEACTLARLEPMRHQAVRLDPSPLKSETAAHLSMLKRVRARAHEFDVLHFHLDMLHFPIFESLAHRTITTQHGRLDLEDYPALFEAWPQYPLVSISQQQREPLRLAHWIGTVPHGIPSSLLQFTAGNAGDYVAFLGRLSPEKRPDVAIEIARRAGIPLRIAAKIDNADATYFRSSIEPLLCAGGVQFIGEIGDERKSGFLGSALALLFPIDWPEPFGLVMLEAMACGTPVIAWRRGSVPEVIEDGVTGAIVDSVDEAVSALQWARHADRAAIRRSFERRFSATTMARRYMDLYRSLTRRPSLSLLPRAAATATGTLGSTTA